MVVNSIPCVPVVGGDTGGTVIFSRNPVSFIGNTIVGESMLSISRLR